MAKITVNQIKSPKEDIHVISLVPSKTNLEKHNRLPLKKKQSTVSISNATTGVYGSRRWHSRSAAQSLSELSVSLDSITSFYSTDDSGSALCSSGQSNLKPSSPHLRTTFSISSQISLFSSPLPEKRKKKNGSHLKTQSCWDSWEESVPKGLSQKSQKKAPEHVDDDFTGISPRKSSSFEAGEISRWSPHSTSSNAEKISPRKIAPPRKPSRQYLTATNPFSPPFVKSSVPTHETERDQEITFNPQISIDQSLDLHNHQGDKTKVQSHLTSNPRSVFSRQPRSGNLLQQLEITTSRLQPWNSRSESDVDSVRRLKLSLAWEESKRSITTNSTRDSSASSAAAYPDYSIPWLTPASNCKSKMQKNDP